MATTADAAQDVAYRQIFEATTDGLVVNDPDTGVVVEVNPAFCAMHGYAYEELIGADPTTFIHPDDHHLFADFLTAFKEGRRFHANARDVRKDGSVFEVEVRAEAFLFRGKQHLLGVVRDVSEAAEAYRTLERRVEERTRDLEALLDAGHRMASALDLDELLAVCADQLMRAVDSAGVCIYLGRDDGFALARSEGPPPAAFVSRAEISALTEQLDRGAGVHLPHTDTESPGARQAEAMGLRPAGASSIVVPLQAGGETIGFVGTHRVCDEHDHAAYAMAIAQGIATQLATAVTTVRLHDRARQAAMLDERHRIARDLHDAVSQTLFSTTMHARAAEMALGKLELPEDHPARRHIADVATLTLGALSEMRALIFELRPAALAEAGLVVALRKHATAVTARYALEIDVRDRDDRLPLSAEVEEELYRIGQEAIGNTVKHAAATRATVEAWESEGSVMLRIADDGRGFDVAAVPPGHLGLTTMRERAERAGGSLQVASSPGGGTTISVRVPATGGAA